MTTLSNEEKASIISQHIKSIEFGLYNAQLDLIEAQAGTAVDAQSLANINDRISSSNAKIAALNEELNSLS